MSDMKMKEKGKNKIKQEVIADFEKMENAKDLKNIVELAKKIIEKRNDKTYNKYYEEYYESLSKESKTSKEKKEKKDRIDSNWTKAEEAIEKENESFLIGWIENLKKKHPDIKNIDFYMTGSKIANGGSTSDVVLIVEKKDGTKISVGINLSISKEYGVSYEFVKILTKEGEKTKEQEIWFKDIFASLFGSPDATIRFAQYCYRLRETNSSTYFFISGETGTVSYFKIKREPDGSSTFNVQGSPASFNLLLQRILNDKEFYKYTGTWEVINKIGLLQNIDSFTNLPMPLLLKYGDYLTIELTVDGKQITKLYRGGMIDVKNGYKIAISAPFIVKTPDMETPKMMVLVYKMDKDGKFIGSERIPIGMEQKISIKDKGVGVRLTVTPSKSSMSVINALLNNVTYIVEIDGSKVPLNPSINNSYIYYSKDGKKYEIKLDRIRPIEPIINADLKLKCYISVTNLETKETRQYVVDLGSDIRINIGDREINLRLDPPTNMTITNSAEYVNLEFNINNVRVTNEKGDDYYLNTISYNGTIKSGMITDQQVQVGARVITLSTGPFGGKQKEIESETPLTQKEQKLQQEDRAKKEALETALTALKIEDLVGFSFHINTQTGEGIWGIVYNPEELISKGITARGDALKQITVKTNKIGWNFLALTGATVYELNQLLGKNAEVSTIKDVTGLGLWFLLDMFALHGEGKVVNEKIEEVISRKVDINTVGAGKEVVFSAFDPRKEGFQILSFHYKTERKAGAEGSNSVEISRSYYSYTVGYRKDLENKIVNSIYANLNVEGFNTLNKEIMTSPGSSNETIAESVFKKWNPVIGIETRRYGAWEAGIRWANTNEYENIKSQDLTVNTTDIKDLGYNLIVRGLPLFSKKLKVDASFDYSKTDTLTKTNDILNAFSTGKNQIIEIQPIAKIGPNAYAYLSVTTELSESMFKSLTSGEEKETKTTSKMWEVRPGYKNRYINLDIFYITNQNETATRMINNWTKTGEKTKQYGFNLTGKKNEDLSFNLSYSRTIDSAGTSWLINGGMRLKF